MTESSQIKGVLTSEWSRWVKLGWIDIISRYRRTIIGPLWIVLVMAGTVSAIGFVYGSLFGITVSEFIPYVAIGIIVWTWVSSTLIEACSAFVAYRHFLLNYPIHPVSVVIRIVSRNLLVLAHNTLIIVALYLFLDLSIAWQNALALIGFFIVAATLFSFSIILAYICARFSDVAQLTTSLLTVLFLVTPVIWTRDTLGERGYIAEFNPMTHLIEVIRQPLLGYMPSLMNWMVATGVALGSVALAFTLNRRLHHRLPFWL